MRRTGPPRHRAPAARALIASAYRAPAARALVLLAGRPEPA